MTFDINTLPLRLMPGSDLRAALETALQDGGQQAAFVVSGIGSLSRARIRRAGINDIDTIDGDTEILTLAGSIAGNGAHLHISIADAAGRVTGGHVAAGCIVRTTAEILLLLLPEWSFSREPDQATGFSELVVRRTVRDDSSKG